MMGRARQHRGRLGDAVNAERGEHDEPSKHDRAKDPADEAGAPFLHHEQSDQDDNGDRHHGRRQQARPPSTLRSRSRPKSPE